MPTVLRLEALGARDLPAVTVGQPYEAYSWAVINEVRRDPGTFADQLKALRSGAAAFGFPAGDPVARDLRRLLATGRYPGHYADALQRLAAAPAVGPLGWDDLLADRAAAHSDWMRGHSFEHTGQDLPRKYYVVGFNTGYAGGSPDVWGYPAGRYDRFGENIGYTYGLAASSKAAFQAAEFGRLGFYERAAFIDLVSYVVEVNSPTMSHLTQLLAPDTGPGGFNAVGVDTGFYESPYETRDGVGEATLSTHRLGLYRPDGAGGFLAGLAYRDGNGNASFDAGEGAAVTITVAGPVAFTDDLDPARTQGVYSRYLPNGTYAVTTTVGGDVVATRTVTIANGNAWFEVALPAAQAAALTGPAAAPAGPVAVRPTIAWTQVPGAAAYQIRLADRTAGKADVFRGTHTPETNWTPPRDLIPGHTYDVSVRAWGSARDGSWGPATTFTILPPRVSGPEPTVAALRPGVIWTSVPGATSYEVRMTDPARGGARVFPAAPTTDTSWVPPADLTSGRTYRVQVRAVNTAGRGRWSEAVTFRVATPSPTGPAGPSNAPEFTWSAVLGAARYTVALEDVTTNRQVARSSTLAGTWVPPVSLVPGHHYRWRVRAENAAHAGLWSPWANHHASS